MNRSPRLLNRVLLGLLGLVLVVLAAHLLLVMLLPSYAAVVTPALESFDQRLSTLLESTRTPGRNASWLWLVVAVVAVIFVVLCAVWALVQGRGRVTMFSREAVREGEGRGVVEIVAGVPEGLLKEALAGRGDILSVSVTAWDQRGEAAGLRVRIQPRPGTEPLRLVEDVDRLVQQLDTRMGESGPVVVDLVTGARSRFAQNERVR